MSHKRLLALLSLLALLVFPLSGALAQGGPPVFCGDLSEADCAILTQAQAAMADLHSAAFDLTLDFTFAGGEEIMPGMDELAVTLLANGAFAADMETIAGFQSPDPEALAEMMRAMPEALGTFLRSLEGEVNLQVVLPDELMASIPAELPDGLVFDFVMVDGVLYVNLEAIAPLMSAEAEAQPQMPTWIGLDLAGMMEQMMEEAGGAWEAQMENMEQVLQSDLFTFMYDPEFLGQFMTVTRLEDAEVAGQTMAAFQTTLDYGALFASDDFQNAFMDYMETWMALQGESMEELPENFGGIMAAMMSGMSFQTVEWIGLDDFYTHHTAMDFAFALDFEELAALVPEAEADDMPANLSMTMSLVVDASAFNEPVEVAAPEGAQVINPLMFMGAEMGQPSGSK